MAPRKSWESSTARDDDHADTPTLIDSLSRSEWNLILKAVGAYRHNKDYRALYEKLTSDRVTS